MPGTNDVGATDAVRRAARPLSGATQDYDPLIGWAGNVRFALLGVSRDPRVLS